MRYFFASLGTTLGAAGSIFAAIEALSGAGFTRFSVGLLIASNVILALAFPDPGDEDA